MPDPVLLAKEEWLYDLHSSNDYSYSANAIKLYNSCMMMQEQKRYPQMRDLFYDTLNWYKPMFDEHYVFESHEIQKKYRAEEYLIYSSEQIEQLMFMRHLTEFSKLLTRASSTKGMHVYRHPDKNVELIPAGYGSIFQYELMASTFFAALLRVKMNQAPGDARAFFYNTIGWFAGLMDLDFVTTCAAIEDTYRNKPDLSYEEVDQMIFNRHVGELADLFSRKGVAPLPKAKLVYKPTWDASEIPHSVEDVVK